MQTKRDWLASKGLAIAGARGKFSNAAKEALAKAELEGMKFSDSTTGAKSSPVVTKASKPEPKSPIESPYLFPSDFRFPEAEYIAVGMVDGKRKVYSMRECCNVCRVSLTNHLCDTPSVYGHPVVIEGK